MAANALSTRLSVMTTVADIPFASWSRLMVLNWIAAAAAIALGLVSALPAHAAPVDVRAAAGRF